MVQRDRIIAFLSGIGAVLILGVIAVPAVWSQVQNDVQTAEKKNTEYAAQVARLEADLLEAETRPVLDPTAAYCRGHADAFAYLNEWLGSPLSDEQKLEEEVDCIDQVLQGKLLPGGRGPLLPDEPSD